MKNKLLLAASLSVLSLGALADSPSFSFVEVGYTNQENDTVGGEFDGFELSGSYALENDFYVAAKYVLTSDRGLDLSTATLGVGYQFGLSDSTSLYAQIDWAAVVLERDNSGQFKDQGYQLGVGVKSKLTDAFQVEAAVKYLNAGEVDATYGDYNPTYLILGADYRFTDHFAIYADYENESESDRYTVGLKYEF